jgi:hypothetical protein
MELAERRDGSINLVICDGRHADSRIEARGIRAVLERIDFRVVIQAADNVFKRVASRGEKACLEGFLLIIISDGCVEQELRDTVDIQVPFRFRLPVIADELQLVLSDHRRKRCRESEGIQIVIFRDRNACGGIRT